MTLMTGQQALGGQTGRSNLRMVSRIAAWITGVSNDALAAAPDDEDKVVRMLATAQVLVGCLSVLGWWMALGIARGRYEWSALPFALLAGLIILTIDRAMGRWIWSMEGRRAAARRGFDGLGGNLLLARIAHLLIRLAVTCVLSLTTAQFLGLALFEQDIRADLATENRSANLPMIAAIEDRYDAQIVVQREEVSRLDERAKVILDMAVQEATAGHVGAAAQVDALLIERSALQSRIRDLDTALACLQQNVDAELYGRVRCDGVDAERGDGDAYDFSLAQANFVRAERAAAIERLGEIDTRLTGLQTPVAAPVDADQQELLSQLAAARVHAAQKLQDLVTGRPEAIRAQMDTDARFVPAPDGLIVQGETVAKLTNRSNWMWWSVHLVLASLLILDLGVVLALSFLPAPQSVVLAEVLTAEVRMRCDLAIAETAIAEAVEQRVQAQARIQDALHRAEKRDTAMRSERQMRRTFDDLVEISVARDLRKAG